MNTNRIAAMGGRGLFWGERIAITGAAVCVRVDWLAMLFYKLEDITMKVSMNGFRRGLSDEIEELRNLVEQVVRGDDYDTEDLVNAMNDVICRSNALNCVYNDGDPDFISMPDVEVEILELA